MINDPRTRIELVKLFHNDQIHAGYASKKRMYAKIRSVYEWKGMCKDISKYVNICDKCKLNKANTKNVEELLITQTPQKAFQKVVIDTIALRKSENNNSYILTMMCDLIKYQFPQKRQK